MKTKMIPTSIGHTETLVDHDDGKVTYIVNIHEDPNSRQPGDREAGNATMFEWAPDMYQCLYQIAFGLDFKNPVEGALKCIRKVHKYHYEDGGDKI